MQEVAWTGKGECQLLERTILYSGREYGRHRQGVAVFMIAEMRRALIAFEPINERLLKIRLNTR